jgi:hypothetical protein
MGFVVIPSNANTGQRSFGFAIKTRFLGSPNIFSVQENNNGPANFAAELKEISSPEVLRKEVE